MIGTVLQVASVAMLAAAAVLVLIRMSRGPSTLDRVVSTELLVNIVIAGMAVEAVVNRHHTTLPIMLVLALLGFTGSVSMARFVADRDKARKWGSPQHHPVPERKIVLRRHDGSTTESDDDGREGTS